MADMHKKGDISSISGKQIIIRHNLPHENSLSRLRPGTRIPIYDLRNRDFRRHQDAHLIWSCDLKDFNLVFGRGACERACLGDFLCGRAQRGSMSDCIGAAGLYERPQRTIDGEITSQLPTPLVVASQSSLFVKYNFEFLSI